jgi:DNA-binding phage protein
MQKQRELNHEQKYHEEIYIPARLIERSGREYNFSPLVKGEFDKNVRVVYDSPYVQPIDRPVHRYMKVEFLTSRDVAVRFSLTDYALAHKDIAALIAVAHALTTKTFEINAISKKAQLTVPNADKILRSMSEEGLLTIISNVIRDAMTATLSAIRIEGDFSDVRDVPLTSDGWKRGTDLIDEGL